MLRVIGITFVVFLVIWVVLFEYPGWLDSGVRKDDLEDAVSGIELPEVDTMTDEEARGIARQEVGNELDERGVTQENMNAIATAINNQLSEEDIARIARENTQSGLTEDQVRTVINDALSQQPTLSEEDVEEIVANAIEDYEDSIRVEQENDEDEANNASTSNSSNSGNSTTTGNTEACLPGDKVGTWSEGNDPHRIEVGGHGLQHLDFYPEVGVKAISYLVGNIPDPQGVPDLAWGYGSLWEWSPPGCEYDLVEDETHYARARLDSGHSGLVVQWGTWEVVSNVANMTQGQIDSLLDQHLAAIGDGSSVAQNSGQSTTATAEQDSQAMAVCDSVREDVSPDRGTTWNVGNVNTWRVINLWSNHHDPNLSPKNFGGERSEYKYLLAPGESGGFLSGGGAFWEFPENCEETARGNYAENPNPEITWDQYQNYIRTGRP